MPQPKGGPSSTDNASQLGLSYPADLQPEDTPTESTPAPIQQSNPGSVRALDTVHQRRASYRSESFVPHASSKMEQANPFHQQAASPHPCLDADSSSPCKSPAAPRSTAAECRQCLLAQPSIHRRKRRPGNSHSMQRVQRRQGLRPALGRESSGEVRPARHHINARRLRWSDVFFPLGVGMDK